jgi:hypothetical protein
MKISLKKPMFGWPITLVLWLVFLILIFEPTNIWNWYGIGSMFIIGILIICLDVKK